MGVGGTVARTHGERGGRPFRNPQVLLNLFGPGAEDH